MGRQAEEVSSDAAARWESRNREMAELIVQARAGDLGAFEALYHLSARWLLSVVRRLVDDGQAEDVLAEVYIQVWRSLPSYEPARAEPAVWLAVIARSRALDHLRREKRLQSASSAPCDAEPATTEGPEQLLTRSQQARLVRLSIDGLDPQERVLVALAYFRDCTHAEIARLTGLAPGAVRVSLSRAQEKLRSYYTGATAARPHAAGGRNE